MASPNVVTTIDLKQHGFKHIASGKVREIFEVNPDILLFIATDRISAYDVILANASPPSPLTHPNNHNTNPPQGIPEKGAILTQLSIYWFDLITTHLPTLRTHLHSPTLPPNIPPSLHPLLTNRTMQVQRLAILPLESIVRGYLTGSAWSEYRTHGTVHGLPLPPGLKESQRLPAPLWTPSTKAAPGAHDENISPARAAEIVGPELATRVEAASLQIYALCRDHAAARGILIADTKFEFGVDAATGALVLVDEVLTPDSSRFWPVDRYEVGRAQQSYDKQFLRDWLTGAGLKGKEGVAMPEEVVRQTATKYREAYELITGRVWGVGG